MGDVIGLLVGLTFLGAAVAYFLALRRRRGQPWALRQMALAMVFLTATGLGMTVVSVIALVS